MSWHSEFAILNILGGLASASLGFVVILVVLRRALGRLRIWIWGNTAYFLASGVLFLQPFVALPVFVALYNGFLLFALCALISTSLNLVSGDVPPIPFIAVAAATTGVLVLLSLVEPARWPRVVFMSFVLALVFGYGALSVARGARAARIRNGPGILVSMFGMGGLIFFVRALVYSFVPHPWGLPDIEADSYLTIAMLLLFISVNFALLVILMARVERELTGKVIELGDSRNNLQLLYDAFSETAGSVDLDELLPKMLDILQRNLHVDVSIIYLKDAKSGELTLVAQRGLSPDALEALLHREKGTILSEQTFQDGTPARRLLSQYPEGRLKESLRALGLAIFAAFPITDRGESLGTLGVSFRDEAALDETRNSLFETMGRQLGSVVRAAILHAELERANARLDILASTDALTHLPNRRTALRVLEREIARAKRSSGKIAVIMCDIDHFKLFNDKHGHDCGDYVLVRTASLIAESLRATDLASRWGGEEFLLILGSADPEGVIGLAERIRKRIQSAVMDYEGLRLSVTITLGVAICSPESGGDAAIAKADEALYEGKRLGRNRVGVSLEREPPASTMVSGFETGKDDEEPLELLHGED
ncbi:MAG TPA: diguanylate cyclase [Rectinemataceae bacterium]|nr:diguanylate cyclase [Rectinemataceae bacterium]